MELFGKKDSPALRANHTRAIRAWVEELLAPGDASVLVTELQCHEPGCPPLETVIALLRPGEQIQHKIPRGLAEVTRDDIAALGRGENLDDDDHHHG